jgi:hypothetical protein
MAPQQLFLYMCLRAGLQPVLVHLSKNKSGKFSFNPISVNLMTEVCKVIFALTVLLCLVSRQQQQQQLTARCCSVSGAGSTSSSSVPDEQAGAAAAVNGAKCSCD